MIKFLNLLYGFVLCCAIGSIALISSKYIPIDVVALSIIFGTVVGNIFKLNNIFDTGIVFCEKHVLTLAIVLMGVNLNFMILEELGYKSIILIVSAITVTIFSSLILSKIFKFDTKFALLIGIGNGICGSSAIAATEKIIGVRKEEVGLSVAIVNFLGTLGIFLLPFLGVFLFKFTQINAGILIGNTLQAVGQVVASGFSIGSVAGQTATIVKMTRILMLTPVVFILIYIFSRKNNIKSSLNNGNRQKIPMFIIGFILFSIISTVGVFPKNVLSIIGKISHFALIIAMSGIGVKITFKSILENGKSALLMGSLIFLIQITFSISMIFIFFQNNGLIGK